MESIIEVSEVTKKYRRQVTALKEISFAVKSRQVFGLLGPNGSGKTTTIKLLLGLIRPTAGEVKVFGLSPHNIASRFKIGYLPEESYFYSFLTGYETLHFYGELYGISRKDRKERIDFLLDLVGLKARDARRKLGEYSKGMTRRIGLAQALINDPQLLILDEPTSGLDPLGVKEFKELLKQFKEEGKTVLLCSHLLADVADTCDRVIILHQGQVVREGNLAELLASEEITDVEFKNLSPEDREELEKISREKNWNLLSARPQRETLEKLFLKTIEEERDESSSGTG